MKGKFNPEFGAYIANSAEFARPVLEKIRKLFHQACPEIEEAMKWSFQHFEYKGIVGSVTAFEQHVGWGFWKATMLKDPHKLFTRMWVERGAEQENRTRITRIGRMSADQRQPA